MKKVEYQPTITFGNILTMLGMMFTIVGCYIAHERRIVVLEYQVVPLAAVVNKISVTSENNTRALDRLTFMLESKKTQP